MIFGSVCSGIEAASAAWHPLGWRAAFFSEIEPFPCAVLAHHYPDVPNFGDMTKFKEWPDVAIDVLVGGTPCQSFSVAGLRKGLDDPRGNLMLTYLAIAERYRPRWLVWENVPGVLSIDEGRAFGTLLGGMGQLGYGFAYRVLDAQYFGVPQRRRRVFVVGHLGDWRRAAAVLFERHSLSGNPPPRREAGQGIAATTAPSLTASGRGVERCGESRGQDPVVAVAYGGNNQSGPIDVATALNAHGGPHGRQDFESEMFIAHSFRGEGFDASEDGTGRGTPLVPVPILEAGARTGKSTHDIRAGSGIGEPGDPMFTLQSGKQHAIAFDTTQITSAANYSSPQPGDPCHPLAAGAHPLAVAFDARQSDVIQYGEKTGPLDTDGHTMAVHRGMAVRRLTPRECERLQDFPDDYTLITYRGKPAADGPRYKALGNSMARCVMVWLGERIDLVDALDEAAA